MMNSVGTTIQRRHYHLPERRRLGLLMKDGNRCEYWDRQTLPKGRSSFVTYDIVYIFYLYNIFTSIMGSST